MDDEFQCYIKIIIYNKGQSVPVSVAFKLSARGKAACCDSANEFSCFIWFAFDASPTGIAGVLILEIKKNISWYLNSWAFLYLLDRVLNEPTFIHKTQQGRRKQPRARNETASANLNE